MPPELPVNIAEAKVFKFVAEAKLSADSYDDLLEACIDFLYTVMQHKELVKETGFWYRDTGRAYEYSFNAKPSADAYFSALGGDVQEEDVIMPKSRKDIEGK